MNRKVRVRFAPSPTGPLHIGGVRTALYNYLFAKKHNGDFLLRIEDTDQTRFVPGAEAYILESLAWCGIMPNEGVGVGGDLGPYRQSERKPMYREYADQLLNAGHAYYAFDTPEELEEMRTRLTAAKVASPAYNCITRSNMKNSLTLSEDEVKRRLDAGEPYVIRVKMPRNEEVRFKDIIRGWVVVHSTNLDDKVLFKSDGMPTYHLANIVDDHLMNITHVIRGEEWLPSAPLHVLLYKYFGWEDTMPEFAHLPLILKPDGNGKLSKRDGDRLGFPVFPLEWTDPKTGEISSGYKQRGYFADGFINMLAMLGWNPGNNQELFTLEELVEAFSLERVGKAGAKFDADKTKWYNQQYLRNRSNDELLELFRPYAAAKGYSAPDEQMKTIINALKDRAVFVEDLLEGDFFFSAPAEYDADFVAKKWNANSAGILTDLAAKLAEIASFTDENVDAAFKAFLAEKSLGIGAVLPLLRIAIAGRAQGPSMFEVCSIIGKEESISRINKAIAKLG